MRKPILLAFLCTLPSFAALSATVQWDVRTTGSDSNSGGFDPGVSVPGTDYSQQNSPQITYTDLVVGSTTTQYTSVLHAVGNTLPGNTLVITGGTGCTTGTYEVLSNATITATVDRSLGTAASVCTAVLGGSNATICSNYSGSNCTAGGLAAAIGSNTIWIKNGTFTTSAALRNTNAAGSNVQVTFEGYNSTHGDITPACIAAATCTRPLITASTNIDVFVCAAGATWQYLNISNTYSGTYGHALISMYNCFNTFQVLFNKLDMSGTTGSGALVTFDNVSNQTVLLAYGNECVNNSTSYCLIDYNGNNSIIEMKWNYAHGGLGLVWDGNQGNNVRWRLAGNACGSATRCVYEQGTGNGWIEFDGNSCQAMANECVKTVGTMNYMGASNNAIYNATYGIYNTSTPSFTYSQGNWFGDISTANYNDFPAGLGDGSLSANPFTSSTVFTLNSTSGGGALLKAAGFPGATPAGTGYIDVGALQSQVASSGSAFFAVQ